MPRRTLQQGSDDPGADTELAPTDLPAGFARCEGIDRNRKPVRLPSSARTASSSLGWPC
ncbi:hypothetical protein [Streptomyces sp. NPDC002962]|uniref:hypothetical protein n=1 Tax=Streptomyces sp. NPDC002962 TaxID=3364674 RepID=UPI0036763019